MSLNGASTTGKGGGLWEEFDAISVKQWLYKTPSPVALFLVPTIAMC